MKIRIKTNSSPNETVIDPGVARVQIEQAYLGCSFVTPEGETLHVSMRDSGFEISYGVRGKARTQYFDVSLQNNEVVITRDPNATTLKEIRDNLDRKHAVPTQYEFPKKEGQ